MHKDPITVLTINWIKNIWNIYEIGLNYTWCNFCKVTYFLHCKFLRDPTVRNIQLNIYCFSSNLPN